MTFNAPQLFIWEKLQSMRDTYTGGNRQWIFKSKRRLHSIGVTCSRADSHRLLLSLTPFNLRPTRAGNEQTIINGDDVITAIDRATIIVSHTLSNMSSYKSTGIRKCRRKFVKYFIVRYSYCRSISTICSLRGRWAGILGLMIIQTII